MSDTLRICPKCASPIPAEAPQGLCPKCVLEQASMATEVGQTTHHKPTPPSIEELAVAFPQLQIIEPARRKFRSYLLGAVKHFLSDARDRDQRIKRGGGQKMESLDRQTETSTSIQLPDPNAASPDHEFDRKWALTLLERALNSLEQEHDSSGDKKQFDVLKPWLSVILTS
jgi:hypothetical protein